MSHEQTVLSILRVWAATAWADGTVADAEAAALTRLIKYSDLPEADQAQALTWLETPVELDTEPLARLSASRKLFIYRVALELARVDLELASPERVFLDGLRDALAIPSEDAGAIEVEVRKGATVVANGDAS